MAGNSTLHIPEGIRFECTGCGNCCLNWPVPCTDDDVDRIERLVSEEDFSCGGATRQSANFRRLNSGELRYRGFTHTLEKRSDGRCLYLTSDNRCQLHLKRGEVAKPGMCQLFPYAFTETPSGIFTYLSFASTGVLFNSGRLLSEQRPMLEEKKELYRTLFPQIGHDWSVLQILDGHALRWDEYLLIEKALFNVLADNSLSPLEKLADCSSIAIANLPPGVSAEVTPPLQARPKIVDQLLLRHLTSLYLPYDVFSESSFDLDSVQLMTEISRAPDMVLMPAVSGSGSAGDRFQTLIDVRLVEWKSAESIGEMVGRFIYSRVFAKLFFGPTYGHFSLTAGLHHLFFVVAVLQLRLKQLYLLSGGKQEPTLEDAAEVLRTIERRMTQTNLSKQSCTVLEVLLSNGSRLPRVSALAE